MKIMNKYHWKIEYSLVLLAIFVVVLFMIPTSFSSKTAKYISIWNDVYNKVDYMFTAMTAQADDEIVKGIKNSTDNEIRENLVISLVQPYLRLEELNRKYVQHYMNGNVVGDDDFYKFSSLYISDNSRIVGIKDIEDENKMQPAFMMLFDMNGLRGPNMWGKDIYGIDIYKDGSIKPLGHNWDIQTLKKDCSVNGTGVSCSHFYRIGGEFVE